MRLKKEHILTSKQAAAHAAAHIHIGAFTKTPGMTEWRGTSLKEPILIYDLSDQPLFYDFPVYSQRFGEVGRIRTSASRVLGIPVPSVYLGAVPWNESKAHQNALELIEKKYRGRVLSAKIVCYAYPKLGIAVDWTKKGRDDRRRTIIDVSDYSIVPEKVEPELRGPGISSVYDAISPRAVPRAVKQFLKYDKLITVIKKEAKVDLVKSLGYEKFERVQSILSEKVISLFYTKILTFCTHSFSHECFLMHGQDNGYYCVVATGQMILDFWRYYYSQNAIATAMGTTTGGTGWAGEVNGLESLTCSHFDAQSDFSPTFAKVRSEIDANRPFDYSYSYHAMACAGYRITNIHILGIPLVNQVYLYDPSPVGTGTIRWETWGSGVSAVAGFVYLRR